MSSSFGKNFKITIFGESHGEAVGVTMEGIRAGEEISLDELKNFLGRRAPGKSEFSTQRKEADEPIFLSGILDGRTCGSPITAIIKNSNKKSSDYKEIADSPRPSHSDYAAYVKYGGFNDYRGGGHFSGRLTAPLCIAGGICLQLLKKEGISVYSHIKSIHKIKDGGFDSVKPNLKLYESLGKDTFPVINLNQKEKMQEIIRLAKENGDSVGGVIECMIAGLPTGIGEPMFEGLENKIAEAIFGIPAVKGIEFGNGFECAELFGSENNDPIYTDGENIKTETNNSGGINGGISNSMPLVFRVAVKPTPSIGIEQKTVSLEKNENKTLIVKGRHDPCIVPRAVPCVEAAAAISVYDLILSRRIERS